MMNHLANDCNEITIDFILCKVVIVIITLAYNYLGNTITSWLFTVTTLA